MQAKKSIEKMIAKEKSPELDKCPPLKLSGIASNITGNVDKERAEEEERGKEMRWISGCVHAITKPPLLFSASLLLSSRPEQNDPSALPLVCRLEGTKRKFLR